jgi:UDP-N-acetylmuramate--alanine ligase
MEDVIQCFTDFVNKVPFYGAAVICLDDPHIQSLIPEIKRRRITYGLTAQADISARNIEYTGEFGSRFEVARGDSVLGALEIPVPGKHNVYNALAATAVALELDIPFDQIAGAFANFRNADRRFQIKGEVNGVLVVDDYGHHPTEIVATLEAAKKGAAGRRTVVVFQPHRFSRTKDLMDDFVVAFNNADVLFLLDIYAASEKPIAGVTAEALAENIRRYGHKNVAYIGGVESAAEKVVEHLRPNDLLITLGAGNVTKLADEILALLRSS